MDKKKKKGQTSIYLTVEDDGNQPWPHINSAFDNPAGWWIFCVTWSRPGKGLTSSRETSSLPPFPPSLISLSLSLPLHIPSNHWHREVNRLVVARPRWNAAVIGSSSEPKLRSTQEGLRVHRSPNAAANWPNKGTTLSSWNLSSGVSASPLLFPLSFLCTFAVNRSQNGRGDGPQLWTWCWRKFGNSHSTVKHRLIDTK